MDWLLPYEGEFETEEELIEILDKINLKVQQNICQQICVPPVLLLRYVRTRDTENAGIP